MSDRKSFLVRIDPAVLDAVRRWADDDLRSMNGQIEFILRKALRDSGREVTNKKAGKNKQRRKPTQE